MKNRNVRGRVLRSYAVSTVSMALVLFVLGIIGYMMTSLLAASHQVRQGVVMRVELRDGLSTAELDSLSNTIASNRVVASVDFVSKTSKLEDKQFRRAFDVDVKGVLGENPLPDSFDVALSAEATDSVAMNSFLEQLTQNDAVTYISYPEDVLEDVHSVIDTMQLLLLLFGGAMLVISMVLLNNTIRLAVFSRREAINTMKLVGATRWFIIRPFLGRGALQGLLAGVVAVVFFGSTLYGINHTLPHLGIAEQMVEFAIISGAMVVLGLVMATLFTLFTVIKFVNMKSNKIYLY